VGQMCFAPSDLSLFDGLVEGLPAGVEVQVGFVFGAPPDVDVQPDGLRVRMDRITAYVDATTEDGTTMRGVLAGSIRGFAVLELDPAENGLHLTITDLAI